MRDIRIQISIDRYSKVQHCGGALRQLDVWNGFRSTRGRQKHVIGIDRTKRRTTKPNLNVEVQLWIHFGFARPDLSAVRYWYRVKQFSVI